MKNLSLEGLTPEQIEFLEDVKKTFDSKNMGLKESLPKEEPNKKFYRIVGIVSGPDGLELDFIAKANSYDPDSLEFIKDNGSTGETLGEYIDDHKRDKDFDIIDSIHEWCYEFDYGSSVQSFDYSLNVESEEISEEEYNDSDKWKKARIETRIEY
jgi:hypothetical protein